jgi:hypothetical protein
MQTAQASAWPWPRPRPDAQKATLPVLPLLLSQRERKREVARPCHRNQAGNGIGLHHLGLQLRQNPASEH